MVCFFCRYGQLSGMVEPVAGLFGTLVVVVSFVIYALIHELLDPFPSIIERHANNEFDWRFVAPPFNNHHDDHAYFSTCLHNCDERNPEKQTAGY